MRKLFALFILVMAADIQADEPPAILVFGDSLSAGYGIEMDQSWTALLQARLEEQGYEHHVVNASISGETSEGGATRIEAALQTFAPELVILALGGNDGLRGYPPKRLQENLATIIERSRAAGAAVVLLGIRIPSNYGPRYTAEFEAVYRQLADDLDIRWIEFFMQGVAMNDALLQADRIHPNTEAQPILLENAWPIISASLADAL